MNKDEAIHKALKVLNCLNNDRVYETAWVKGAINACEEALEQPAEPRLVSYALDGSTCTLNIDGEEVYFNREQPAQEPVAWMGFNANGNAEFLRFNELNVFTTNQTTILQKPIPLYTHPHQWQGLTDDEIVEIYGHSLSFIIESGLMHEARNIEQVLKEKNGI